MDPGLDAHKLLGRVQTHSIRCLPVPYSLACNQDTGHDDVNIGNDDVINSGVVGNYDLDMP